MMWLQAINQLGAARLGMWPPPLEEMDKENYQGGSFVHFLPLVYLWCIKCISTNDLDFPKQNDTKRHWLKGYKVIVCHETSTLQTHM